MIDGYDAGLSATPFCAVSTASQRAFKKSVSYVAVSEWARLLARVLKEPTAPLSQYRHFLPLVEASIEKPALEHQHRRARADNAIVLASLGFHVFYNLYVAHLPQGTVWTMTLPVAAFFETGATPGRALVFTTFSLDEQVLGELLQRTECRQTNVSSCFTM